MCSFSSALEASSDVELGSVLLESVDIFNKKIKSINQSTFTLKLCFLQEQARNLIPTHFPV